MKVIPQVTSYGTRSAGTPKDISAVYDLEGPVEGLCAEIDLGLDGDRPRCGRVAPACRRQKQDRSQISDPLIPHPRRSRCVNANLRFQAQTLSAHTIKRLQPAHNRHYVRL